MGWFTARGRQAVLVRTTVGSRPEAERLARRLVVARLAACVHVGEVASMYRWDGRVQEETEFVVEARTDEARRAAVAAAMAHGHPYQVPLVETVPVTLESAAYANWMAGELR